LWLGVLPVSSVSRSAVILTLVGVIVLILLGGMFLSDMLVVMEDRKTYINFAGWIQCYYEDVALPGDSLLIRQIPRVFAGYGLLLYAPKDVLDAEGLRLNTTAQMRLTWYLMNDDGDVETINSRWFPMNFDGWYSKTSEGRLAGYSFLYNLSLDEIFAIRDSLAIVDMGITIKAYNNMGREVITFFSALET